MVAGNAINLVNHGMMTGQAVVYRAGNDTQGIAQLTNSNVYYVIKIDDNTVKLAATLDEALVGAANAIAITNPGDASHHSLTRVVGLSHTGSVVGGKGHDTVVLLASGRLTDMADGGGGFNTLVGPDANATWTSFDAALKQADRLVRSDDAANRTISAVDAGDNTLTTANAHGFQTGDAVVYSSTVVDIAGGKKEAKPIGNLKDDATYFVIRVSDTTIKLAATREDAFANRNPITPGAIDVNGTGHKLSRATLFTGFWSLAGGTADDSIGLTMKSIAGFDVSVLAIDGGGGTNTLRANLDADTQEVSGRDELVWTMTGTQSGWVADRQAQLLLSQ